MNRNRFLIILCCLTALFCALSVFYNFYSMPPYGPAVLQTDNRPASKASSAAGSSISKAQSAPSRASSSTAGSSQSEKAPSAAAASSQSTAINLNTATLEQLEALPSVGPTLAQRILDYRTQNGPFHSVDELDNVKGIGPAILEKIRNSLFVT